MLEDYEEFISLTLRTISSRKPLRMLERDWKHQWLPLCLARRARRTRMGRPVARLMISSRSLHVSWKPVSPHDCVWKNLYQIIMRTILQERVTIHYNVTIWYTNLFLCLKQSRYPQQKQQWINNLTRLPMEISQVMNGNLLCLFNISHFSSINGLEAMSDNGRSLLSLIERVTCNLTGVELVLMTSPEGDHQANGLAEVGVREIKAQTRILRSQLEQRLGSRIDEKDPLMSWTPRHAANCVSRYRIMDDGRTPDQRRCGKDLETSSGGVW